MVGSPGTTTPSTARPTHRKPPRRKSVLSIEAQLTGAFSPNPENLGAHPEPGKPPPQVVQPDEGTPIAASSSTKHRTGCP